MKDNIFTTFFVMLIFISIPLSAIPQDKQCPQLVLQEREFEFGQFKEGRRITHAFTVLNRGDAPLKIKKVSPG